MKSYSSSVYRLCLLKPDTSYKANHAASSSSYMRDIQTLTSHESKNRRKAWIWALRAVWNLSFWLSVIFDSSVRKRKRGEKQIHVKYFWMSNWAFLPWSLVVFKMSNSIQVAHKLLLFFFFLSWTKEKIKISTTCDWNTQVWSLLSVKQGCQT